MILLLELFFYNTVTFIPKQTVQIGSYSGIIYFSTSILAGLSVQTSSYSATKGSGPGPTGFRLKT